MVGTVIAIAILGSTVQIGGTFRPVDPSLSILIDGSAGWFPVTPALVSDESDSDSIYVVKPDSTGTLQFGAVRISLGTGDQSATTVELGPNSRFRPFVPAKVNAVTHGLRFERPVFHLFRIPDEGKGPGFHFVDSATGQILITLEENGQSRTILTGFGVNSEKILDMSSRVSIDPKKRFAAALLRGSEGLHLYFFPLASPPPAQ